MKKTYSQLMGESPVHLTLTIDTKDPIELGSFVGMFTSLGNEFERFIKESHPDLKDDANFFVKEVRAGSTIVDIIPELVIAAPFISQMDQILIAEEFIKRWGVRLTKLIKGEDGPGQDTKNALKDWADAVEAIARDPDGSHTLELATFEDGKREIKAAFKFSTQEAKSARRTIELKKQELDKKDSADHRRVLMVFTRSDINNVDVGKRSGELVLIEEISQKPLALMYGSNLSEKQIKHEVREADENVFKKGFVVDVNVQIKGGKPVAYAVTHVHQVIDLPDGD
ncbi:MAG: hypothetical protein R3D32_02740 [Nitratireductor sp.]